MTKKNSITKEKITKVADFLKEVQISLTDEEFTVLDDYVFRKMCRLEDADLTDSRCYKALSSVHSKMVEACRESVDSEFVEIPFTAYADYGTHCNFSSPNRKRKYIKSLSMCLTYAPMSVIYPGIKHPVTHEMHELWKQGYVKKYTKPQYVHVRENGYKTYSRIWYKATTKGVELLRAAVRTDE